MACPFRSLVFGTNEFFGQIILASMNSSAARVCGGMNQVTGKIDPMVQGQGDGR
jgi:hypothetical protein